MATRTTFTPAEVESLRRSAAMAPLPVQQLLAALDDLRVLHRERAEVQRLVEQLGPDWQEVRHRLNLLVGVVNDGENKAAR